MDTDIPAEMLMIINSGALEGARKMATSKD